MTTFNPDWASPPGDTILDILKERLLSHGDFSKRLGCTLEHAEDLIHGRLAINEELAGRISSVLGASAKFWMRREAQYRDAIRRNAGQTHLKELTEWLGELPVKDMTERGWIEGGKSASELIDACMRFFNVRDIATWRTTYRGVLEQAAFRTSPKFAEQPGAVAAWLRQGEIESASIDCKPWNARLFSESLHELRKLTRTRKPELFIPELVRTCSESGVAVAIVRSPTGCRASGATRFLSPSRALLLLSFRYLSDDHFWFTFFHEAGHLLLHSKDAIFLEGEGVSSLQEQEANDFSARTLIPGNFRAELETLPIEKHAVRDYAKRIGVSPGIIIGQLQHLGRARRNQLNNLKTYFSWEE
ncbi:ImmA/IrrE family metallo-endopeptidase [Corallococcus exiguus]|uniref:ImmA/IrrE family metallo-endopeptidase n=1 Tax=Corallococcus exiguus TaxID=83462 RepID=UPI0014945D51|nr:ImmA/IrrE family metallo-endopeptidase [Corallococcus exiguus]NPD29124.1 ImmA/IrrE family metallo-endopeptidase [Corallococcus exiguus]